MPLCIACPPTTCLTLLLAVMLAASGAAMGAPAVVGEPVRPPPSSSPSVALFYGQPVPIDLLSHFDQVVVDPDHIDDAGIARLRARGATPIGYLSVGEIDPDRSWSKAAPAAWRIGENRGWGSTIVDQRQAGWHELVIATAEVEWRRGFRGFFLDTLDSYQQAVHDPAGLKACERGLVDLIRGLRARLPGAVLIVNRGFEVLPEIAGSVSAVAAESLFREWDTRTRSYVEVKEADRQWLLGRLNAVVQQHHLPVIVIDYLPPSQRSEARALAAKIAALGFTPWVSAALLDSVGVGAIEVLPRTVLMIHDSAEAPTLAESAPHRLGVMPLEHLGYTVEYLDARNGELPAGSLVGRYAGIVTWFTDDVLPQPGRFRTWIARQLDEGMRVAIVGDLGYAPDAALLGRLGLAKGPVRPRAPLTLGVADRMVGFEARPTVKPRDLSSWRAVSPKMVVHAAVREASGQQLALVGTAPWGGFAFDPFVLEEGIEGRLRWVLDPFAFYRAALGAPPPLVPDTTTENGRRLLTAHIDGDGFLNLAEIVGRPYSAETIRDRILKVFPMPVTVSVIEGEIGAAGVYAKLSPKLEEIARSIFALDNVELASHSYSHPFDWEKAAHEAGGKDIYHLPIPDYRYDPRREVVGSVEYINRRLAPPGKQVKVFLWSGEALPGEEPLRIARQAGLVTVNGGNTQITRERDSLTEVAPIGIPVGGEYQVYAAIQNENIFTNLWHGPFYGYRTVLESFRLTDAPRRLKPLCIYHHFYSGEKVAALAALEEVYRAALDAESLPVWLSDWARKASEFQSVTVARLPDGGLELKGAGALRTVRVDPALGFPDLARSRGVVGYRDLPQGRYVSLDGKGAAALYFTPVAPRVPYLRWANAQVVEWSRQGARVELRLRGHLPVRFAVAPGTGGHCTLAGAAATSSTSDGEQQFALPVRDTGMVTLACP